MRNVTLTDFDMESLQAFAKAHGRKWKSVLTDVYWYNARIWEGPKPGMGNALHGLRNSYGPSWLADFKLPKAEG